MYKKSYVAYNLSNGTQVKTLDEAKASGLKYQVVYIPEYEVYPIEEKVAARRLVLA